MHNNYKTYILIWYCYLHADRLDSGTVVTNISGDLVHILAYMPYGETLLDLSHTPYETPYQFTCYEKDQETGLHYAEARYYDSDKSIFISTDPMWQLSPHLSPYAYCNNNPINRIDPNGMVDDWIVPKGTNNYIWRDDVTAKSTIPDGFEYVGANDADIIAHMGLSSNYETKTDIAGGIGFVSGGDKNIGPLGQGIPGSSITKVKADLLVSPNVSYNSCNITQNNITGKTFEGVNITAYVSEQTVNSNPDLQSSSSGFLSVFIKNNFNKKEYKYTTGLKAPIGEYVYSVGTKPTTATINIPTNKINGHNIQKAIIRMGRPNTGLLINIPTKISWNLQVK